MSVEHDITAKALESAGSRVLHAGDDYDYQFTLRRDGSPFDLAGATVWLTVKEDSKYTDDNAKLQLTTPTQIEILDATEGVMAVHFAAADTEGLEGEWSYDIKVRDTNGLITRFARGVIEFLPNLTRAS